MYFIYKEKHFKYQCKCVCYLNFETKGDFDKFKEKFMVYEIAFPQ